MEIHGRVEAGKSGDRLYYLASKGMWQSDTASGTEGHQMGSATHHFSGHPLG
jgi:hypothetical protein